MADFTTMVEVDTEKMSSRMFGEACSLVDELFGENSYKLHPDLVGSVFIGMSNNLNNVAWGMRISKIEAGIDGICASIETLKKGK